MFDAISLNREDGKAWIILVFDKQAVAVRPALPNLTRSWFSKWNEAADWRAGNPFNDSLTH